MIDFEIVLSTLMSLAAIIPNFPCIILGVFRWARNLGFWYWSAM